jgi:ASC-1-like (ASCH) protein
MTVHELKLWHAYFLELASGEKALEVRFGDDRLYTAGDQIRFHEWEHGLGVYTGRWITARIAGVQRVDPATFGLPGLPVWALALAEVSAIQELAAALR